MKKEIAVFGCGHFLARNWNSISRAFDIKWICDNDAHKVGKCFYGVECISPDMLKKKDIEVLITVEKDSAIDEIASQLRTLGVRESSLNDYEAWKKRYSVIAKFASDMRVPMRKVIVGGSISLSRRIYALMETFYSNVEVVGFIDYMRPERDGIDYITQKRIFKLRDAEAALRKNIIDGILVETDSYNFNRMRQVTDNEILNDKNFFVMPRFLTSEVLVHPER